jgi:flagellar motor switch protein FliG
VTSLKKVPPAVLGAALKAETPRMIATVLKQLPAELSGKVLELLPAEQRQNVFLMMADKIQISSAIVGRVLQRVLDVCRTVNPAAVARTDRRVTTLIGILQTVEREEKIRLMETLAERDPELAAKVDDLMYDYTDVLRIEDRSVQKLLGQLEQKIVAMALKTAPDDLREKIMKNLSERVRLALTEEMELLSGVTPSKADQARREIATVIRNQDKEGAIMWMEG